MVIPKESGAWLLTVASSACPLPPPNPVTITPTPEGVGTEGVR